MAPKKSAGKIKAAKGRPEPTVKTSKLKKATAKSNSEPKKVIEEDEAPGADLFEHIRKRDLLSVAAPLASRKRAADFFDSESENDQQRITTPNPKKPKRSKDAIEKNADPPATGPTKTGNKKRTNDAGQHSKSKKPSDKNLEPPHAEIDSPKKSIRSGDKSPKAAREGPAVNRSKQDSDSKKGRIQSHEGQGPARHQSDHPPSKTSVAKRVKAAPEQRPSGKENAARLKKSKQVRGKGRDPPADAKPVDGSEHHSTASEPRESSGDEEDQTAALLRGFESSEDEDTSGDEGFEQGRQIPKVPTTQNTQNKLARIKRDGHDEPGVLYVGRIPHGFYEDQMRAYFSQFGEITRLRLSRNRVTGRSKHYAFIEFASSEVAQIVADTMNNYLLFGHILKCRIVPEAQIHEGLWKGANKRYRPIPQNKIQGKLLEAPKSRDEWTKKVEQEAKRRQVKSQKLKSMGYEFELPVLKTVDEAKLVSDEEEGEGEEAEIPKQLDVERKGSSADGLPEEREMVVVSEVAKEREGQRGEKSQKTKKTKKASNKA